MMTSQRLFTAVALATTIAITAVPPAVASASTSVAHAATTSRAATTAQRIHSIGVTLAEVRTAAASGAATLKRARREFGAARTARRRWAKQLAADTAAMAQLQTRVENGVAELYMLNSRAEDQVRLIEQYRTLKARLALGQTRSAEAAARLRLASAAVTRALSRYNKILIRKRKLEAAAAALGVRFVPRTAGRSSRSGRTYVCPVAGRVQFKDDFGERRNTGRHTGIDMLSDYGTPVVAIFPGVVGGPPPGDFSAYGNLMTVRDTAGNQWWYAHLSSKRAKIGQRVVPGEVIGYVGCSGRCYGPHLHFEYHRGGAAEASDPYSLLTQAC